MRDLLVFFSIVGGLILIATLFNTAQDNIQECHDKGGILMHDQCFKAELIEID